MDITSARAFLASRGYRVAERVSGWHKCLLEHGDERWVGQGVDAATALRDAVHQAFPSELSRALLAEAIARETSAAILDESRARMEATPGPPPVEAATPDDVLPANDICEAPATEEIALSTAGAMDPAPSAPLLATETITSAGEAPPDSSGNPPARSERCIVRLRSIRLEIEERAREFAMLTPTRQRLVLLIWIAHARSVQDEAPGDGRVRHAGAMIASALGRLARGCWPGTVPALRADALARDAHSALRFRDPSAASATWKDVARAASASLADLEVSESARGADDDGWFDAARTRPGPGDPDQVLAAIANVMVSRYGALGEKPSWDKRPSEEELLEWARELRWIRRDVSDPVTWGLLAGRIRHWLDREGDRFTTIAREFAPEYVPPGPWAAVLGFAIGRRAVIDRERETKLRAALASPPDGTANDDAIATWLAVALPSWDTHAAEIVAAMKPFEARVLVIPADAFEAHGRRIRRCLGKLKVALTSRDAKLPASPPRQQTPPISVDESGDALAQMPRELRERVVVRTRGLRALFVGNRRDPELLIALERVFEFSTLECSEAEPRRVDSVVASIESHRYDVVLGATGFLDHTVDRKIARAARAAEIRYVRVHRGRPQASLLAVAREYGVAGDRGEWRLFDDPS